MRAYVEEDGTKKYGAYSTPASITLLSAPTLQRMYQTSNTRVDLFWTAVTNATGYEIYRKTGSGSYVKVKTLDALTGYNSGLTVGTAYTYKVRAYREEDGVVHYGDFSNEMTITPIRYTAEAYPESDHPYANSMNTTWTYTLEGAQYLIVKFSSDTLFESGYDKLYVTDGNGAAVGTYTWTNLAGAYLIVTGDTVNIRLKTDGSVTRYGFKVELIAPAGQ